MEEKKEEDERGIRIGKLRKTGADKSSKAQAGGAFGEGDMERYVPLSALMKPFQGVM